MKNRLKPYWLLPWVVLAILTTSACKKEDNPADFCRENEAADFKTAEEFKAALLGKWAQMGYYGEYTDIPTGKEFIMEAGEPIEYRANDSVYSRILRRNAQGDTLENRIVGKFYTIGLTPKGKIGLYEDRDFKDFVTGGYRKERVYYYLCKDKKTLILDFNYSKASSQISSHISIYNIIFNRQQ